MEKRTLCLCVIVLSAFVPTVLMQQQQQQHHARKRIQSETRIKLPSDIAFTHENTGDIEGEACFNLVRKIDGVCALPNQCPEAIRDFQKGIQPQICNYKGHLPIICCPRSQKPVTSPPSTQSFSTSASTTIRSTPSISTTSSPSINRPASTSQNVDKRISEKKCAEYMKLMIEESVVSEF